MNRIYHTWDKWECYPAGFYENKKEGMTKSECELEYKKLLSNPHLFKKALDRVLNEWPLSCEHYLSNEKMNRIAWLGQAALCIETGIPSCFRSGYFLLSKDERNKADLIALDALNLFLRKYNEKEVDLKGAGVNSHANIY